jgi:hypothetical protein
MEVRDELHDLIVFILGEHIIGDRTTRIIVLKLVANQYSQWLCQKPNQVMNPLSNTEIVCAVGKLSQWLQERGNQGGAHVHYGGNQEAVLIL